ncbi:hypothetical protein [Streptomyces sp. NBC_01750]|nr:hypothetical protein [Streptomyces sp. NBC_01750]WSD37176.1 hypothetical protein OG966_37890 [Streptomyces sp. NBC_01750]
MILPVVGRPSRPGVGELAVDGVGGHLCVGGEFADSDRSHGGATSWPRQ